jgi:hypothetical protein
MEDEYKEDSSSDLDTESENNYIMYKIVPKNNNLQYCYIGHTSNFNIRKNTHYRNTINQNDKKHYHLKHYQTIRENGGWEQWEMVPIETYQCKTKLEARIREQELIDEYGANLNSLRAYISPEDYAACKKQVTEKYREDNKEKLREQTKKYKQDHKEVISEQMKKYRAENKQKILEKTREYREKNKEQHQEWQKVWREKNKELLKEKRKIYEAKKKQQKLEQQQTFKKQEEEKEQSLQNV